MQEYPHIHGEDFIDIGIEDVQRRDNSTATYFSGEKAPVGVPNHTIWNDTVNKILKYLEEDTWIPFIDYSKEKAHKIDLEKGYQPISNNLFELINHKGEGQGIDTGAEWIPISDFYINNFPKDLNFGKLSKKSEIITSDLEDGVVTIDKLDSHIAAKSPTSIGDVILSLNQGTKDGFVKLSKTETNIFTVGSTSSNSTYAGLIYKNLYNFLWNKNYTIYNRGGVVTTRGNNSEEDWISNKKIELPTVLIPGRNKPANNVVFSGGGGPGVYTVNIPEGRYYVTCVGGGGGSGGGCWKDDHKGGGGGGGSAAGFYGVVDFPKCTVEIKIGNKGNGGDGTGSWTYALGNKPHMDGTDGEESYIKGYITCGGGTGGKHYGQGNSKHGNGGANNWYGYSRNGSMGGQGGKIIIHNNAAIHSYTVKSNGNNASGWHQGSDGGRDNTWINGGDSVYNNYGYGADGIYKSGGKDGGVGIVKIVYISPSEYNTFDTNIINGLDLLLNDLTFFMKY